MRPVATHSFSPLCFQGFVSASLVPALKGSKEAECPRIRVILCSDQSPGKLIQPEGGENSPIEDSRRGKLPKSLLTGSGSHGRIYGLAHWWRAAIRDSKMCPNHRKTRIEVPKSRCWCQTPIGNPVGSAGRCGRLTGTDCLL